MWIKAAPLRQMRSNLRARLPVRAFLKRDRGAAMFVSNAPVFDPTITQIPSFIVRRQGMLMHISPDASWLTRFERRFRTPPDHLCQSLLRFYGERPTDAAMALFIRGAKLLDAGDAADAASLEAFDRDVRRHAALALRTGMGGGCYALAVLDHIIHAPDPGDEDPSEND